MVIGEKKKEPSNVTKVPPNARENKTIRECDKSAVTCDAGAT